MLSKCKCKCNVTNRNLLIVLLVVALFSGCSTTFLPRSLNNAGLFPTKKKIPPSSIRLVSPFHAEYRTLAYIMTDSWRFDKEKWKYTSVQDNFGSMPYDDFFVASISKTGVFANIVHKWDLELLVINRNLSEKITSISDMPGLQRLQQEIGTFLILQSHVRRKSSNEYFAEIKAIDPRAGEVVLLLQNSAFNTVGLDESLLFPLLNAFLQWTRGEEISTSNMKYDTN